MSAYNMPVITVFHLVLPVLKKKKITVVAKLFLKIGKHTAIQ